MFYLYFILVVLFIYVFSKLDKLMFKFLIFIFITLIAVIAGLRYEIGTDYPTYRTIYDNLSVDTYQHIEPGYRLINLFFKYVGLSYAFTVFIFSFIVNLLFYRFIKKYSSSVFLSLLLYVLLNYYFIAFNAVRQMIAISIFLQAIPSIENKKYLRFILITLFAASFHYTALIGLIYVMFKVKCSGIFFVFWFISLVFIFVPIQAVVLKLLPASFKYSVYLSTSFFTESSSLAVLKSVVPNLIVLFLFFYLSYFQQKEHRFWLNVFIFSVAGINVTHGVNVLIRLNYIFLVSEIIFYPLCISKFDRKERSLVAYVFLTYFILFYILTVLIQGAQGVVPYRSILFL